MSLTTTGVITASLADVSDIDPFHVMEVVAAAQAREQSGQRVFHLEVGQPSTGAPSSAIAALATLATTDTLGYTTSRGIPELPPAIADHIARSYGLEVDPARIAITQGASGAFVLALLAAFQPGARVGVTAPGYPCYRNMLRALHMEPVTVALSADDDFSLNIADLEAVGPLDGVIVASPSNPTGTVMSPGELETIIGWCDANGVRFISDEIYHGLTYDGAVTTTATAVSDKAIVINSFSKYFSMTGWRMGWMVLPEELLVPVDRLAQNLVICPPTPSQHVALAALDCSEELDAHVHRYATNRQVLLEGLPRAGITNFAPADGAFYLWARTDHLAADSQHLSAEWLRDFGVAATPGIDFHPTDGHRWMRFSFAGPTEAMHGAVDALSTWRMRQLAR